ncbi:MAG: FkbM family methyltransferase [bacterium]
MVRLELPQASGTAAPPALALGQVVTVQLRRDAADVETRAYIRHEGVHYLTPLSDWTTADTLAFYPEAPGAYTVMVDWRSPAGTSGRVELPFSIAAGPAVGLFPCRVTHQYGTRLWTPSQWEGRLFAQHEPHVMSRLDALLPVGAVAWDIGANIGTYTLALARLVGPSGRVYAFEPNPLCVYFLRMNLSENALPQCEIFPLALSDAAGELAFTMNFGNCHLGMGAPSIYHAAKLGHAVTVRSAAADALLADGHLRAPQLVKIDVEGGEGAVIRGMAGALQTHRPVLMMELHGYQAARDVLATLEPLGYRFETLEQPQHFASAAALAAWFPDTTLQVLGTPS